MNGHSSLYSHLAFWHITEKEISYSYLEESFRHTVYSTIEWVYSTEMKFTIPRYQEKSVMTLTPLISEANVISSGLSDKQFSVLMSQTYMGGKA